MITIDFDIKPKDLKGALEKFWQLSGDKIEAIEREYPQDKGSPVFTVNGKYDTRGWTEWTQGFQFGSSILQFDYFSFIRIETVFITVVNNFQDGGLIIVI